MNLDADGKRVVNPEVRRSKHDGATEPIYGAEEDQAQD